MATDTAKPVAAGAAQPSALSTGALKVLGEALTKAATAQAVAEHGVELKLDHTVPGGRYKGADGSIHDAHGNVYDKDGETIVSAPAVSAMGAIAGAQTPEELDAMIAAIDSRKKVLEELKATVDSGTQRAAGEGSSKTKSQDANLPGDDEVNYTSWSRERLEKEAARLGIVGTKGTGVNGTLVKADLVKALDTHRAQLAGQPGPSSSSNVAL